MGVDEILPWKRSDGRGNAAQGWMESGSPGSVVEILSIVAAIGAQE
jgi:hypothetical protein